jgi:RNA polymerase sigma-70 factor (ECF subfamily)
VAGTLTSKHPRVVGARVPLASDDYDTLYRQHRARILRLCGILLRDRDEAEDVTQDVFLVLHRERDRGARRVGWAPWLTRVAVNACHRRRRSRWWRVWHATNPAIDVAELAESSPTPEAQAVTTEERRTVLAVFNGLSRRQQEVFLLRHVEGYSTDEVATMLGVRTGSVKRHLFRATHAFQKTLRTARDVREE